MTVTTNSNFNTSATSEPVVHDNKDPIVSSDIHLETKGSEDVKDKDNSLTKPTIDTELDTETTTTKPPSSKVTPLSKGIKHRLLNKHMIETMEVVDDNIVTVRTYHDPEKAQWIHKIMSSFSMVPVACKQVLNAKDSDGKDIVGVNIDKARRVWPLLLKSIQEYDEFFSRLENNLCAVRMHNIPSTFLNFLIDQVPASEDDINYAFDILMSRTNNREIVRITTYVREEVKISSPDPDVTFDCTNIVGSSRSFNEEFMRKNRDEDKPFVRFYPGKEARNTINLATARTTIGVNMYKEAKDLLNDRSVVKGSGEVKESDEDSVDHDSNTIDSFDIYGSLFGDSRFRMFGSELDEVSNDIEGKFWFIHDSCK